MLSRVPSWDPNPGYRPNDVRNAGRKLFYSLVSKLVQPYVAKWCKTPYEKPLPSAGGYIMGAEAWRTWFLARKGALRLLFQLQKLQVQFRWPFWGAPTLHFAALIDIFCGCSLSQHHYSNRWPYSGNSANVPACVQYILFLHQHCVWKSFMPVLDCDWWHFPLLWFPDRGGSRWCFMRTRKYWYASRHWL